MNGTEPLTIDNFQRRSKRTSPNVPKFDYDPTGFRTSTSVSLTAFEDAVAKLKADHLVHPSWMNQWGDIQADCARKGIPLTPGKRHRFDSVNTDLHKATW